MSRPLTFNLWVIYWVKLVSNSNVEWMGEMSDESHWLLCLIDSNSDETCDE